MKIAIQTQVKAPLSSVWKAWTDPDAIKQWNFASDDWCCSKATLDLQSGGKFSYRMEAKDGSMGFDFAGEFTAVEELKQIRFHLSDQREVEVLFTEQEGHILVQETFESEDQHSAEQQRQGWQSILDNFKTYAESL